MKHRMNIVEHLKTIDPDKVEDSITAYAFLVSATVLIKAAAESFRPKSTPVQLAHAAREVTGILWDGFNDELSRLKQEGNQHDPSRNTRPT